MSERYGPQGFWIVMMVLAAVALGFAPVLVRWLLAAGVHPLVISFSRFALAAVLLLPFLGLRRGKFGATVMGMIAGAAMAYGWIGFAFTLERVNIATAGVLYMSYPLFSIVFAVLLAHEVAGRRGAMAALLSAVAIWLVLPLAKIEAIGWEVIAVALAAPVSFGFAVTILANWMRELSPMQRIAAICLGAVVGLLPAFGLHSELAVLPPARTWGLLLALAAGTVLIPGLIYIIAAPRIGSVRTAVIGALELPAMLFFALYFFGEHADERELVAAVAVITAILVGSVTARPRGRPPAG